jgi:hypothetical protein
MFNMQTCFGQTVFSKSFAEFLDSNFSWMSVRAWNLNWIGSLYRFLASLFTSCDSAVPTTCEQDVSSTGLQQACYKQVVTMLFQQLVNKMSPQQACSKLVNKLWQYCSNNLSIRCLLNRLVASLLTSCDNAVPTTCEEKEDVFVIGL